MNRSVNLVRKHIMEILQYYNIEFMMAVAPLLQADPGTSRMRQTVMEDLDILYTDNNHTYRTRTTGRYTHGRMNRHIFNSPRYL